MVELGLRVATRVKHRIIVIRVKLLTRRLLGKWLGKHSSLSTAHTAERIEELCIESSLNGAWCKERAVVRVLLRLADRLRRNPLWASDWRAAPCLRGEPGTYLSFHRTSATTLPPASPR